MTATCAATLTGAYSPTGTVTFSSTSGNELIQPESTDCAFSGGNTCQASTATIGAGSVAFTVAYSGDQNNNPASTSAGLFIQKYPSTLGVACSNSTVVIGEQTNCTAAVTGYLPTGTVSWAFSGTGAFSPNPCPLSDDSCTVSFSPASSGTITATYSGDTNNFMSTQTTSIAAAIIESIQISVADSAPQTTVTLSGCSVSPTAITANGIEQTFTAASGCTGLALTLPPAQGYTRYVTAGGEGSMPIPVCSSSPCEPFSATIYYQVENTYEVKAASPALWGTSGSILVNGTALGSSDQTVCTISVATGTGEFSCEGWTDYDTQAVIGALHVSQDQRWATGAGTFTDITGGNLHISDYYSQVLEDFQYSLVGSATAPTAPSLNYTGFGAPATLPLTGSQSLVWMDTGSSWNLPPVLAGSTASERWATAVTSGAATAGQTVSITYYHQYLISFSYTVVGGGTAYSPPAVASTSFGAPQNALQGWVDAGSSYSFTNPLAGSTANERWFAQAAQGMVSASGTITPVYYHQYAFEVSFSVSGGGVYDSPRLNFTSLGTARLDEVNATAETVWVDSGTKWSVGALLPNSSPSERWITNNAASGTAVGSVVGKLLYYHQYLGTLHYSILGSGGSPPVPRLNYTALGAASAAPLNKTAGGYWIDSGSTWGVALVLPGGQGERWLSNVTLPVQTNAPFAGDVQYAHQFYVEVGVNTPAGGLVANADQWKDQGSTEVLNATASKLWTLSYWQGVTPFSYNGTTALPTLTVLGPANETAMFYPSLTIFSGSQGSVSYSFGSISGIVPPGSNATVYPPPGRNVTLTAQPNTVEIMFSGWSGDLVNSHLKSAIAISTPAQVKASFATDYDDIRTFAIATIGVFIAAAYVFVIRRGFAPKINK